MKNTDIASVRTATPAAWAAAIVWLAKRAGGLELTAGEAVTIAAGLMVVLHRVAAVLGTAKSGFWRGLATVLVGINTAPAYPDGIEPAPPAEPADTPQYPGA